MPLSEYEKQRLENIQRNQELLRQLEIPQLGTSRKRSAPSSIQKHQPKAHHKEKQEPTRRSARLRGIAAEAATVKERGHERDEPERKAARIDRLDDDQQQEFLAILRQMPNTQPETGKPKHQDVETQASLRDQLSRLEIRHPWATVKVTTDRINCIAFHPSNSKVLVCAGDTSGNLGFWDVNGIKQDEDDQDQSDPVVYTYRPHTRTMTDLHFDPADMSKLYTSSYDGTIQYFDMQHASFHSVPVDDSYPFTSFDLRDRTIWFSTSDGQVGSHDIRSNATSIHTLRDKKIGCIHINPQKPHLLAAASNDRTATVWDVRSLGKSPLHELAHGYAVTSAYWSPRGNKLATASYDDYVRLFDLGSGDLKLQSAIRHNNHTGRWVTNFRARWNTNPTAANHQHLVIGNMKHPIDIISGETGAEVCSLSDPDRLTAIQAVAQFHPSTEKPLIATGNASGRMACWS